jgi:hypothetical protein
MESSEIILRLLALIFLGGYLLFKHRQRIRNWPVKNYPHSPEGETLAATLQPRLQKIRNDYSAELHSSPHSASLRANLVARAAQTLGRLEYFRDKDIEHEHQSPAS